MLVDTAARFEAKGPHGARLRPPTLPSIMPETRARGSLATARSALLAQALYLPLYACRARSEPRLDGYLLSSCGCAARSARPERLGPRNSETRRMLLIRLEPTRFVGEADARVSTEGTHGLVTVIG